MDRIIGEIIPFFGLGIPPGFAPCDGESHNTIVTPDLRGCMIVGSGEEFANMRKYGSSSNFSHTISTDNHTLTIPQMPAHHHRFECRNITDNGGSNGAGGGSNANDHNAHYNTDDTGGGQPHNHGSKTIDTTPPMMGIRYCCFVGGNYKYTDKK